MELWLMRHGTTGANTEGRFQGRLDYPLSSQGLREALFLADRVKNMSFDLLLSSDLIRAWVTAEIISSSIGLEPVSFPLLRECSWGAAEGLTLAEAKSLYPGLVTRDKPWINVSNFGGESEKNLSGRATVLLRMLYRSYGYKKRIALVSHGRFINAIITCSLGLSKLGRWPFAVSPASLSIIRFNRERRQYCLDLFNDRCHLDHGDYLHE